MYSQDVENALTTMIDDETRIQKIDTTSNSFNDDSDDSALLIEHAQSTTLSSNVHSKIDSEEENRMRAFGQGDEVETEELNRLDQHIESNLTGGEVLLANGDGSHSSQIEDDNVDSMESSLIMGAIAEDEEQEAEAASHNFPSLRFAKDRAKKALGDAKRRVATARLQKQAALFSSEMYMEAGNASLASIASTPAATSDGSLAPASSKAPPAPGRLAEVAKKNNLDQYLVESIQSRGSGRISVDSEDNYTVFTEGEMGEMAKGSFAVKQIAASEESDHRTASFIQFTIPEAPPAMKMQDPPIPTIEEDAKEQEQSGGKDSIANVQVDRELVSPSKGKPRTWISQKVGAKKTFGSPSTSKKKTWKDLLRQGSPVGGSRKKAQDPEGTKVSDEVPTTAIVPQSPKVDAVDPVEKHEQPTAVPQLPAPLLSQSNLTESSTVSTASDSSQRERGISPHSTGSHEQNQQQPGPRVLTTMQMRQETRTRQRAGPRPTVSGIQWNKIKPKEHKRGARVQRGNRRLTSKSGEKGGLDSSSRETPKRQVDIGSGHIKPRRRRSFDGATTDANSEEFTKEEDTAPMENKRRQRRSLESASIAALQCNTIVDSEAKSRPRKRVSSKASDNSTAITATDKDPTRITLQRRNSFDSATIGTLGAIQDKAIVDSPSRKNRKTAGPRRPIASHHRRNKQTSGNEPREKVEARGKEAKSRDHTKSPVRRRKSFDSATIGALKGNTILSDSPMKGRRRRIASKASDKAELEANDTESTNRNDKDKGPERVTPSRRRSFDGGNIAALQGIVDSLPKSRRKRVSSKASEKVELEANSKMITALDQDKEPERITPQREQSFDSATALAMLEKIIDSPLRKNRKTAGARRPIANHHKRNKQTARNEPGDKRENQLRSKSPARQVSDRSRIRSKSPARQVSDRTSDRRLPRSRSVDKAKETIGRTTSANNNIRQMRKIRNSHSPVPRQKRNNSDDIPTSPDGIQKESVRRRPRGGTWGSSRDAERDRNGGAGAVKPMRRRVVGSRGSQPQVPSVQASSSHSAKDPSSSVGDKEMPSSRRVPIRKSKDPRKEKVPVVVEDASDSESEIDLNSELRNQRPSEGQWMEPIESS